MGGTEILQPLAHVFAREKAAKDLRRHVFLLTDGAVFNTSEVISLIADKAMATDTRVHTLGIGSGASTELVKGAARAGLGAFFFVSDPDLIEETVVNAMQVSYLPTRQISNIIVLGSDFEPLKDASIDFNEACKDQRVLTNDAEVCLSFITPCQ